MNREEIIRMAREAGFDVESDGKIWEPSMLSQTPITDEVIRFAALIAAAKQEQCADAVETLLQSDCNASYASDIAAAIRALK